MNITPKVFRAVRDFSCAGQHFATGDVVPPSLALQTALGFGEQFVIADTRRTQSASENPTPTPTEE